MKTTRIEREDSMGLDVARILPSKGNEKGTDAT
jgi:hypothetical protein